RARCWGGAPAGLCFFGPRPPPPSRSTWKSALSPPLAAMIELAALLIAGFPASPSAGSVASWLHVTGCGPLGGLSFASAGDTLNAVPIASTATHHSVRLGVLCLVVAPRGARAAIGGAAVGVAGVAAGRVTFVSGRTVIMSPLRRVRDVASRIAAAIGPPLGLSKSDSWLVGFGN